MSVFCERIAKYQNTKGSIIIAGKRTYVVIAAKSVPFHLVLFHCHERSDGFARIPHPTLPLLQRCSELSHHRSQYARFIQLVHCHGHDRHPNLGSFRLPSLGHVSHVFGADESCTPRGTLPTGRRFPCRCHRRPSPNRDYCNLTRGTWVCLSLSSCKALSISLTGQMRFFCSSCRAQATPRQSASISRAPVASSDRHEHR